MTLPPEVAEAAAASLVRGERLMRLPPELQRDLIGALLGYASVGPMATLIDAMLADAEAKALVERAGARGTDNL